MIKKNIKGKSISNRFVVAKNNDKTVTVFDLEKSILYTFNETASYIFGRLRDGISKDQIASFLSKQYGVPEEKVLKDVKDIISFCRKNKLLINS